MAGEYWELKVRVVTSETYLIPKEDAETESDAIEQYESGEYDPIDADVVRAEVLDAYVVEHEWPHDRVDKADS